MRLYFSSGVTASYPSQTPSNPPKPLHSNNIKPDIFFSSRKDFKLSSKETRHLFPGDTWTKTGYTLITPKEDIIKVTHPDRQTYNVLFPSLPDPFQANQLAGELTYCYETVESNFPEGKLMEAADYFQARPDTLYILINFLASDLQLKSDMQIPEATPLLAEFIQSPTPDSAKKVLEHYQKNRAEIPAMIETVIRALRSGTEEWNLGDTQAKPLVLPKTVGWEVQVMYDGQQPETPASVRQDNKDEFDARIERLRELLKEEPTETQPIPFTGPEFS